MHAESRIGLAGLLVFVLMAIFEIGPIHPDEHFQLLEFAQYRLGNIAADDLPWEFHEKMRPTLQVWVALGIIKALHFIRVEDPFTIALILRLISAVLFWFVILRVNRVLCDHCFREVGFSRLFQACSYLIWFVPLADTRFSSESYSAIFLLLGIYPLIEDPRSPRGLLGAGFLLGLSFLFRYQIGISIAAVYLWLLLVARVPARRVVASGLVLVAVLACGSCLDSAFYGEVVFAPFEYFKLNLIDGRASEYGVDPWYFYLTRFTFSRPVIGMVLLYFFVRGLVPLRMHVLAWVVVPFILVHCLISHKEMRFLFPVVYPFLFVSFHGYYTCFKERRPGPWRGVAEKVFLALNLLTILALMIRPHPTESNYRYLYRNIEKGDRTIISSGEDYYGLWGLRSSFYRPEGVTTMVMEDGEDLATFLGGKQVDAAFLIHDRYDLNVDPEGYSARRVHSVHPEWLVRLRGADWRRNHETATVFLLQREARLK